MYIYDVSHLPPKTATPPPDITLAGSGPAKIRKGTNTKSGNGEKRLIEISSVPFLLPRDKGKGTQTNPSADAILSHFSVDSDKKEAGEKTTKEEWVYIRGNGGSHCLARALRRASILFIRYRRRGEKT